ncbi:MAG TPA: hypothetical protein K8V23_03520 [Lactobacillus crispatus]|uniref:Uncharacterized protein n=1 Tax=Lactobacillus crispatus TaxID=47770 RepID=A0A921FHN1_9LACO|nr:hypothetical protein [Lactobacillus crispatus]
MKDKKPIFGPPIEPLIRSREELRRYQNLYVFSANYFKKKVHLPSWHRKEK